MSASPLVSVIIVNFNNLQFLEDCVNSVLYQTYPNVELVFADDCSTDQSIAVFEKLVRAYEQARTKDSSLAPRKIVRAFREENGGIGVNRQTGLESAEGEWLCFLDSDDYLTSDAVESIISNLADEHVDIVIAPTVEYAKENDHFARGIQANVAKWEPGYPRSILGPAAARATFLFNAETWMYSRLGLNSNFVKSSLFNPHIANLDYSAPEFRELKIEDWPPNVYSEDCLIVLTLKLRARKVQASPAAFYNYRISGNSAIQNPQSRIRVTIADINFTRDVPRFLDFKGVERIALCRRVFTHLQEIRRLKSPLWRQILKRTFFDADSLLNILPWRQTGAIVSWKFRLKVGLLFLGFVR